MNTRDVLNVQLQAIPNLLRPKLLYEDVYRSDDINSITRARKGEQTPSQRIRGSGRLPDGGWPRNSATSPSLS